MRSFPGDHATQSAGLVCLLALVQLVPAGPKRARSLADAAVEATGARRLAQAVMQRFGANSDVRRGADCGGAPC